MSTQRPDPGSIYDELDRHFEAFSEDFESSLGLKFDIDAAELANVAQSYVYDLERYVKFHEVEIPDRARRGAYICKWLMRLRPVRHSIQLDGLQDSLATMAVLCNELFSLYVLSATLKIDLEVSLSPRMGTILLYSMRYRATSEDTFILLLAKLCLLT